jgi:glycosyltransferase involved in cell wall biosynthesis
MHVAFINENTLGHASYLLPFVRWFTAHPEAGIQPHVIDAMPLPPDLQRRADFSIPLLRRYGLDFQNARWRFAVSQNVRQQLAALRVTQQIDAVVVNTQSVALQLGDVAKELPVCVCLDATFHQLASSPWFAPNTLSRWFNPVTLGAVLAAEREVLPAAAWLFPWSQHVAESLRQDYALPPEKIQLLSPSLALEQLAFRPRTVSKKPRLLFIGGDFKRKGGPLLLEVFAQHFADRAELDIVTFGPVTEQRGVKGHRDVKAYSPEWHALWAQADAFVFPSTLETFGLVLLEAMAFGAPVIAAPVGAAAELLGANERGLLLSDYEPETLRRAIEVLLTDYPAAIHRAAAARAWVEEKHSLALNAKNLGMILTRLAAK